MQSFFFREPQLITFLFLVCNSYPSWSTRFISLKACVEFSIFDFVSFLLATSKTWTQTLDPDPGPGPRKTWTLKNLDSENLDSEKPGPWKIWAQKNLDPEKPGLWKTWTKKNAGNSWMQIKEKKIRRPHGIIY